MRLFSFFLLSASLSSQCDSSSRFLLQFVCGCVARSSDQFWEVQVGELRHGHGNLLALRTDNSGRRGTVITNTLAENSYTKKNEKQKDRMSVLTRDGWAIVCSLCFFFSHPNLFIRIIIHIFLLRIAVHFSSFFTRRPRRILLRAHFILYLALVLLPLCSLICCSLHFISFLCISFFPLPHVHCSHISPLCTTLHIAI